MIAYIIAVIDEKDVTKSVPIGILSDNSEKVITAFIKKKYHHMEDIKLIESFHTEYDPENKMVYTQHFIFTVKEYEVFSQK